MNYMKILNTALIIFSKLEIIKKLKIFAINYLMNQKYYGPEDANVLELYFYLGQIHYYLQDFKKSKEYIEYALPITIKLYPENIYNIILGNYVLSILYTQTGDIEKAILKLEYLLELLYTDKYDYNCLR